MSHDSYPFIIAGGGLAAASAVEGIREMNAVDPVLMVCAEEHLPYNRPPLSKDLWFGEMEENEIFVHDAAYYRRNKTEVMIGSRVISMDPLLKTVTLHRGDTFHYDKLLLATGGNPRTVPVVISDLDEVIYYRTLDDYRALRQEVTAGKRAVVVGGGLIGSEMAAALRYGNVSVTMVFPEEYMLKKILPDYLGQSIQSLFQKQGVHFLAHDRPVAFFRDDKGAFIVRTAHGHEISCDMIVAGLGIIPSTKLAEAAGLDTGDGVKVNEFLQTSHPDIYAAGDNTLFPYPVLKSFIRIEHWDNALNQGKLAGRNMAGADEPYVHMPAFNSRLFSVVLQGVGDVNAQHATAVSWERQNIEGTIYYLDGDRVCGVLTCNLPGRMDEARKAIRSGMLPEELALTPV